MKEALTIYHLHDTNRGVTLDALDAVMQELEYGRDVAYVLGNRGPRDMMDFEVMVRKQPLYLLSDTLGEWVTLIQAHSEQYVNAPGADTLPRVLSRILECTILALTIREDGFAFTLHDNGNELASKTNVTGLEAFLPDGTSLDKIRELLESSGIPDETKRLEEFGSVLKLHGNPETAYPFATWQTSRSIQWTRFFAVSYFHRRPRADRRI
jgi:hypothetical protein